MNLPGTGNKSILHPHRVMKMVREPKISPRIVVIEDLQKIGVIKSLNLH